MPIVPNLGGIRGYPVKVSFAPTSAFTAGYPVPLLKGSH